MTKDEQAAFVTSMTDGIRKEITTAIRAGRIPPEWNGHELRMLLAEKFRDAAGMSVLKIYPRSKRTKDYRNTVIINNL